MLLNLFHSFCAANDRRRARDVLQDFCDDRVKALRALDKASRHADQALRDATDLEREQFRESFFSLRDPVRSGFIEGSAKLFGITAPTRKVVRVPTLSEIGLTKYSVNPAKAAA